MSTVCSLSVNHQHSPYRPLSQSYNHYRVRRKFGGVYDQIASLAIIYFTKSYFGRGSLLTPLRANDAPLVGWGGGYPFPISIPFDAFGLQRHTWHLWHRLACPLFRCFRCLCSINKLTVASHFLPATCRAQRCETSVEN